jgi:hypothetical protein
VKLYSFELCRFYMVPIPVHEPFIEDMRMAKFADNTSLFYWGDGIGS